MIYITGDTHIPEDINKLSTKRFPEAQNMTSNDYVIICGDFGGVWNGKNEERYWIKWLYDKKFITLFVDGNHENHQMLNDNYPVVEMFGGKTHQVNDKLFHLMRGEIFCIDGHKIFAMGGAESHDKEHRKEGISWWPQEMPSEREYDSAVQNLKTVNWEMDYVITHCAPSLIQKEVAENYPPNKLTDFLQNVAEKLHYKKWFFGHYHIDRNIDERHICVFQKIIRI